MDTSIFFPAWIYYDKDANAHFYICLLVDMHIFFSPGRNSVPMNGVGWIIGQMNVDGFELFWLYSFINLPLFITWKT